MPSIASTTFGRPVRTHRLFGIVLLSALLSACGTLSTPEPATLDSAAPIEQATEPVEAAAFETAKMPEAIASPEATLPALPTTQSARRFARKGQPLPAPTGGRDGPGTRPPAELLAVPDAIPRHEPLHPSANRPYSLLGRQFTPGTTRAPLVQSGAASWYGSYFHGRRTSTGEIYDMYAMSAAHPTMPLPSFARVTNTANGHSVVVRVNDRGPFVGDRIIDLSYAAAARLGFIDQGVAPVKVEVIRTTPGIDDTLATSARLTAATALAAASASSEAGAGAGRPVSATVTAGTAARAAMVRGSESIAKSSPSTNTPAPTPRKGQAAGKVFVKIGAFRQRMNAARIGERIAKALPTVQKALTITPRDDGILLVQAGPFADRSEAIVVADALRRELQIEPQIVLQ